MRRFPLLLVLAPLVAAAAAEAATPAISSGDDGVTVFAASWCSACQALEQELRQREVPFVEVDVEKDPQAFERARRATGENAIPQTEVATQARTTWVVGADADAVERAYRGR